MNINPSIKSFLSFLPLISIYTLIILLFASNELVPDETRYIEYATNLTHGYYADSEDPVIWNGPGYPLVISVFVLAKAPYIVLQLLNVVFLTLAVWFLFKSLSLYINKRQSLVFSYLFGLYPPMLRYMVYIYTEPLAILSACGFMYYALKVNPKSSTRTKDIVMSAFFLGLLALTRVEFGYVITCALFIYAIWYVIKRSKKAFHSLMILAGALAFCLPYLYYTYNLTGKAFLWGTQGGAVLYWRATPFENEYGDWISSGVVLGIQKDYPYDTDISALAENHLPFIEKVESSAYSAAQKDQMYRQKAFEYMKMYPVKYLKNTGISALRLFFEYPISYKTQKLTTYFYLLPNIFLVMLLLIAIYLTFLKAPAIPFEVIFIALIMLISVGGMILASGRVRHLLPIVPMFSFYIAYTIVRFTKIEIK